MPSAPLNDFFKSLHSLDYTRKRMEHLFQDRRITLGDINSVYEALFLRAVTSFEGYLEDLFLSILKKKTQYPKSRVNLRMTPASNDALMDILLQGGKYMTWLPFDNTEKRAKIYLKDGRPFCELDDGDKSKMKSITVIRNAIAHKSSHAMNEFVRTVIGSQSLLRGEKKPAGYLRSQIRTGPVQNRFEVYIFELARIAQALDIK